MINNPLEMSHKDSPPESGDKILICYADELGDASFMSGTYDLFEKDYFDVEGELISSEIIIGWTLHPDIIWLE